MTRRESHFGYFWSAFSYAPLPRIASYHSNVFGINTL